MNEKLGGFLSFSADVHVKGSRAAQAMRLRGAGGSPSLHLPIFFFFAYLRSWADTPRLLRSMNRAGRDLLMMRNGGAGCEEE